MPSSVYNAGIYAPVRQTAAAIQFELTAPEAKERAVLTTADEAAFSRRTQLIDSVSDISAPVATFEPDYWRLDGSFILPTAPEQSAVQIGWWSAALSDGTGRFADPPEIDVTFSEAQDIARFGIQFDAAAEETVSDLSFFVYDSGGGLIFQESISGNTAVYAETASGAQNVSRVVIRFYGTKNPFRRARVAELVFGIRVRFDDADILSLELVSEADPEGKTFPTNELNLTIVNNGRFDQLDSESMAQYLRKRQAFEYSHGLTTPSGRVEWVFCGAYLLDSWTVSDDRVTFMAKGKSAGLDNSTFYDSTFEQTNAGTLAERLFLGAGFEGVIPAVLRQSPAVSGFFDNVSYRRAMAALAEMTCCALWENRQNNIALIDLLAEAEPRDGLDYNNLFAPPQIKLAPYYNGVTLRERTISRKMEQLARVSVAGGGTAGRRISVYFDRPLSAVAGTYSISAGATLADVAYHAMYMTATLFGGAAEITVTGESASFAVKETFYAAPWRDPLEPAYGYTVDLPMFFTDNPAFREWFLARKFRLLRKRLTLTCAWRQNPAQKTGDTVSVQVNKKNGHIPMITVMERIDYKGGVLSGGTKTIGEAGL